MRLHVLWLLLLGGALSGCPGPGTSLLAPPEVPFSLPNYRATLRQVGARRARLATSYRVANPTGRAACLRQARQLLLTVLDSAIFPAWASTPWAFYGQSWEPRRGHIACGYFVTTALHDAGLRLERTYLAQQASEAIIQNLTTEPYIRRYRGVSQVKFVRAVQALGPGLYVVGLDFHVAFLRVRAGHATQMVHASYLPPVAVVGEAAASARALASKYRVVGNISADTALIRRWLLGQALPRHALLARRAGPTERSARLPTEQ